MKLIKKASKNCVIPNGISYCPDRRVGKLWALKIPLPFTKIKFSYMQLEDTKHRLYLLGRTAQGIKCVWLEL